MLYKKYIEVIVHFDKEGKMTPMQIIWDDGIHYDVDKILQITQIAYSQVGGGGTLYRCRIGGHERKLFFEQREVSRWFIESHKP